MEVCYSSVPTGTAFSVRILLLLALSRISEASQADLREESSYYEYFQPLINGRPHAVLLGSDSLSSYGNSASRSQDFPSEEESDSIKIEFEAFGHSIMVNAVRDAAAFHPNYKEIVMLPDGSISTEKKGVPKCFYEGNVTITGHEDIGVAYLSLCSNGVNGVIHHPSSSFEMQYMSGERKHVIMDFKHHKTSEEHTCGVKDKESMRTHKRLVKGLNSRRHEPHILAAAICNGSPTKYVDVLLINDQTRYQIRGSDTENHSASIFTLVHKYYFGGSTSSTTYGGIQGTGFNCQVAPRLIGQLTWLHGEPSDINIGCTGFCARNDVCTGSEISSLCYLESLRSYTNTNEGGLKNIFGEIDNYMLLSDRDFDSGTVGLAFVGTVCGGSSQSITQADFASIAYTAATAAHELGHNFGMEHDTISNAFVMAAQSSTASIPTEFSSESRQDIDQYFALDLTCLDVDRGDTWQDGICGNGALEAGEQCDPGFDFFSQDSCCNNDCTLVNGCECSNLQPCCDNGSIRPSTHVCRSAVTSSCDFEERCDGVNGECPVDLFKQTGVSCSDTTANGISASGTCFKGDCLSPQDTCPSDSPYQLIYSGYQPADHCTGNGVACKQAPNSPSGQYEGIAQPGTPCGTGKICSPTSDSIAGGECVDASTIRFYHWFIVCPGTAVCRSEDGSIVSDAFCTGTAPVCNETTPEPTPFPTLDPTSFPTVFPTLEPTPLPPGESVPPTVQPTSSPTAEKYFVTVIIQSTLTEFNETRQAQFRLELSGFLGIADDSFTFTVSSGSVTVDITFESYSNGKSPRTSAQTLAVQSAQSLSNIIDFVVLSISDATDGTIVDSPSSGGGGGGGDDNTLVFVAIIVVVVVVLGGCIYFCCCRTTEKRGNQYSENKSSRQRTQKRRTDNRTVKSDGRAVGMEMRTDLPVGWTQEFTQEGQIYFHNHNTGTSQWNRPMH